MDETRNYGQGQEDIPLVHPVQRSGADIEWALKHSGRICIIVSREIFLIGEEIQSLPPDRLSFEQHSWGQQGQKLRSTWLPYFTEMI